MDLEKIKNDQEVLLEVISNKVLRIQQLTAEVNSAIIELSNDHTRLWEEVSQLSKGHNTQSEGKANGQTNLGKEEGPSQGAAGGL